MRTPTKPKVQDRSPVRRGFAMILAIIGIGIIASIIFVCATLVAINARAGSAEAQGLNLLYLAQTGLSVACSQLAEHANWPSADGAAMTNNGTATVTLPGQVSPPIPSGTATVTVTDLTVNNPSLQIWQVVSTGQIGQKTRTLTATVQNASFSRYALFVDNTSSVEIYLTSGEVFSGPMHTNGHFSFYGQAQFTGQVTSANTDDQTAGIYNPVGPVYNSTLIPAPSTGTNADITNPSQFYHAYGGDYSTNGPIAATGATQFSFQGGQPVVPMPLATSIAYNPSTMTEVNGDATIVFNSSTSGGTVTVNSGSPISYSATNPLTLYVNDGNVTSVSGTVNGAVTIIAGSDGTTSTGNITVTNNVVYHDQTSTSTDLLGLVASNNIYLTSNTNTLPSGGAGMEIDGSIMAIGTNGIPGSISVPGISSSTADLGTLQIFGGTIAGQTGEKGFLDGVGQHGYITSTTYDNRLSTESPPSFPKTGHVLVTSLIDSGALQ